MWFREAERRELAEEQTSRGQPAHKVCTEQLKPLDFFCAINQTGYIDPSAVFLLVLWKRGWQRAPARGQAQAGAEFCSARAARPRSPTRQDPSRKTRSADKSGWIRADSTQQED